MTALSSKKILQEQNSNDPSSITSLNLTHRALTDVSCLGEFKNLERLDLSFNNLTSLEGLKSCTNLKWLSVKNNKLQSLKGIDGLHRLTVLNAGLNKLKSMDDVKSLSRLRALILNDNEISSICNVDQMKELNTLVLSKNPIHSLGESLVKQKSITKLSLSHCQLQNIDSSLRSCVELKELRLAHNEITTIPDDLRHLVKLQNLDMGNNVIARWSNLKVLSSLVNLRILNLQGNPLAEKENLQKKVKKLLPNLRVFNTKIDKIAVKEVRENAFSVEAGNELNRRSESKIDQPMRHGNAHPPSESMDDLGSRNKRKELQDEKCVDSAENNNISEKRKKKKPKLQQYEIESTNNVEAFNGIPEEAKDIKPKKKKSRATSKGDTVNITESEENPSMDLLSTGTPEDFVEAAENKLDRIIDQSIDAVNVLVTYPTKKKQSVLELSRGDEIGLGGPSAWDV